MVSCVARAAFVLIGGRTKSDGGRVTPGTTLGKLRGGRNGTPVEYNTYKILLRTQKKVLFFFLIKIGKISGEG